MADRTCSEEGCDDLFRARGLCNRHYLAARRTGVLDVTTTTARWHRLSEINTDTLTATCAICGPATQIRVRLARGRAECVIARRERRRRTRSAAQKSPQDRRRYKLKSKYGITVDDYEQMLASQGGVCAICDQPPKGLLVVDHCHETGRVRGLLCRLCNLALGYLRDDPAYARAAAEYLG